MKKNILSLDELESVIEPGKKIVLVGGCFDLLHYGHFTFLQNAKKHGDLLVLALESDEFIKNKKKREPVHSQQQRAEILAALQFVDYVVLLPLLTKDEQYFELVKSIHPAVIAVTEHDPYLKLKKQQAEQIGAQVEVVTSLLHNFSSTNILSYANISRD